MGATAPPENSQCSQRTHLPTSATLLLLLLPLPLPFAFPSPSICVSSSLERHPDRFPSPNLIDCLHSSTSTPESTFTPVDAKIAAKLCGASRKSQTRAIVQHQPCLTHDLASPVNSSLYSVQFINNLNPLGASSPSSTTSVPPLRSKYRLE